MQDTNILKNLNYTQGYWYLRPTNVEEDIININTAIAKDNNGRNERPIHMIGKSEYTLFTALIICAVVYSDKDQKVWNKVSDK